MKTVMATDRDNLSALRDLGSPGELWDQSRRQPTAAPIPTTNAHVHLPPNFSAFTSATQAVDLAAGQGLAVLGASNYYDYQVYDGFIDQARRRGVFPLMGLEVICLLEDLRDQGIKINDPGNPGKMYLCGKGITRWHDPQVSPQTRQLLDLIRRGDARRMAIMVERLEAVFAQRGAPTGLTAEVVIDTVARRYQCDRSTVYLQERHIAQAFIEALWSATPGAGRAAKLAAVLQSPVNGDDPVAAQNQLRSRLMKAGQAAFVEERFIGFEQARQLIVGLGGVPCYPVLADGAKPICPFEDPMETLIARLREYGITAVEFIPTRNQPGLIERYVPALRRAGMAVTAGTEHNTLESLAMTPTCCKGQPIPDVAAAHQLLSTHGQCGLVDEQGRSHPDYADADNRIAAFARLGATVIDRYRRRNQPR
jgi:hypothetical protein